MKYLSADILLGFNSYKYTSLDTSPFSNYVMHPFWNVFVKMMPMWLAANLMTFTGFLLLVINFFVLSYYDYDFMARMNGESIPRWIWLMCGFNNFMSHTLDGADGKQARRTGTSSALGELFDHGLDAWSTTFFAVGIYDIFGQGTWGAPPFRMFLVMMAVQMTFIFSHWEKYNTGVLYLPWGYDPAIMGMTVVYLLTYIFHSKFWEFAYSIGGGTYTIANYLEAFLYFSNYFVSIPICIFNVYLSYKNKTGKMRPFGEMVRPLLPVCILYSACLCWAWYSPNRVLDNYPRCFYLLAGTLFANITSRLIVNQMSSTRASAFNTLMLPLIVIVPLCVLNDLGVWEMYILHVYTGIVIAAHILYGSCVVNEMADHLKIRVFSVDKPVKSS